VAWHARPNLVVRAGGGFFYDLGYSDVANAMSALPYVQEKFVSGTSFPLSGNDPTASLYHFAAFYLYRSG
jgi:hypothetical protein